MVLQDTRGIIMKKIVMARVNLCMFPPIKGVDGYVGCGLRPESAVVISCLALLIYGSQIGSAGVLLPSGIGGMTVGKGHLIGC